MFLDERFRVVFQPREMIGFGLRLLGRERSVVECDEHARHRLGSFHIKARLGALGRLLARAEHVLDDRVFGIYLMRDCEAYELRRRKVRFLSPGAGNW